MCVQLGPFGLVDLPEYLKVRFAPVGNQDSESAALSVTAFNTQLLKLNVPRPRDSARYEEAGVRETKACLFT